MKEDIKKCQELFDSISCLCCEGPEFMSKIELMSAIGKDAGKGYDICKRHLIANAPDTNIVRCAVCGDGMEAICKKCQAVLIGECR